jgi:hypothetical protein
VKASEPASLPFPDAEHEPADRDRVDLSIEAAVRDRVDLDSVDPVSVVPVEPVPSVDTYITASPVPKRAIAVFDPVYRENEFEIEINTRTLLDIGYPASVVDLESVNDSREREVQIHQRSKLT